MAFRHLLPPTPPQRAAAGAFWLVGAVGFEPPTSALQALAPIIGES